MALDEREALKKVSELELRLAERLRKKEQESADIIRKAEAEAERMIAETERELESAKRRLQTPVDILRHEEHLLPPELEEKKAEQLAAFLLDELLKSQTGGEE